MQPGYPHAISGSRAQSGSSKQHIMCHKTVLGPSQPNPASGAALGNSLQQEPSRLCSKAENTTASLQPQPAVTSPKPCHNFRGTWRKTSVTFCWGKAKANAKLTLYAGLAPSPPRAAPQQRFGTSLEPRPGSRDPHQRVKAEPSISCAQEGMEGVGGKVH